ncbi:YciI family protein [Desulfovibrio aminophilus]|uniref:YciI family protein n=1 Tax=Desulfovibrio aminophilus TaxID=81425 RepID=UPI003393BA5E
MFIVLVRYVKPLPVIDSLLEAHINFLEEHFRDGAFLVAGRQEPRTGGVILARAESRGKLEAILARDPFAVEGAATYEITRFVASRTAPELAGLREEA